MNTDNLFHLVLTNSPYVHCAHSHLPVRTPYGDLHNGSESTRVALAHGIMAVTFAYDKFHNK